MTAATAESVLRADEARSHGVARKIVLFTLAVTLLLAIGLLGSSLLPSAALAGRLMAAAGVARTGTITQDLVAHLGERLRLAAGLLLALTAGVVVLRVPFEELVAASLKDATRAIRWPAPTSLLAVGAPTLLGAALRATFLSQPMRYDEALTFNEFSSRPLYYGLSFYPDPNNHLLNTLLVHLAYVGLGNQPWILRLPAFLGGVLLVPATHWLASLVYGRRAAFLSAMLVAVSSYVVEYSTNSRGYTLQALSFVLVLGLVIVAVRRDSLTALLLAALVAAIGAYAMPTMLYGVAVASAWLLIELRGRQLVRFGPGHLAASGLVLGLLVVAEYLPVVLVSGPDRLVANRFVVALSSPELATELPRSLVQTWTVWNRDMPLPVAAALVAGFALATVADVRSRRTPLGVLAPAICLAIVLVQRVAPFARVWLFLLPLYFVIASGGLARVVDGRFIGVLVGAILAVVTLTSGSILSSGETGAFPDAEAVAQTLSGRLGPDDAVVTTLPASLPELQYYFPRSGLSIDALVRPPASARYVYVVAAPAADPRLPGWSRAVEVKSLPSSRLFELER